MADINLIRIDQRMIHGQVAVKWTRAAHANKIVCVDDAIAQNEMMKKIYKVAAPSGTKVLVYSVDRCMEKWNETQFQDGTVMMLFKDVDTAYRVFKAGFPMKTLDLGNAPNTEKTSVDLGNEFHVTAEELEKLKEMDAAGVRIEIKTIPEKAAVSFKDVI